MRRDLLEEIINATGCRERRKRRLPAHLMIKYVIALALYFTESYQEVMRPPGGQSGGDGLVARRLAGPGVGVDHRGAYGWASSRCGNCSPGPRCRWPPPARRAHGCVAVG